MVIYQYSVPLLDLKSVNYLCFIIVSLILILTL